MVINNVGELLERVGARISSDVKDGIIVTVVSSKTPLSVDEAEAIIRMFRNMGRHEEIIFNPTQV